MALHKKPTKEELQAQVDEVLKEGVDPEPEPTPQPDPESKIQSESEPKDDEPKPDEDAPEPSKPIPSEPEPSADWKEQFRHSSREALVQQSKSHKLSEAIDKAGNLPAPTDEELKKEYPEWEMMSETEQRLARDGYAGKKALTTIVEATQEFKKIDEWKEKVDQFSEDPQTFIKFPLLEGKTDEFKIFSLKPSRRGLDFEDLVAAFLYEASKAVKINKGKMFDTGGSGGGEKSEPKSNKISIEEAGLLMEKNYDKYKEYLKAGLIDFGSATK